MIPTKVDVSIEHNGNGFDLAIDEHGDLSIQRANREPEITTLIDDIILIMTTRLGSHPVHPDMGLSISGWMSRPISEHSLREMNGEIYRALSPVVPRDSLFVQAVQLSDSAIMFLLKVTVKSSLIALPFMFNVSDGLMEVGDLG